LRQALAKAGAHVLLVGRTQGALEELYDIISSAGGEATGVPLDLTDFDALDRLGATLAERWGKLDILVGNAGLLGPLTPTHILHPMSLKKPWR
jgi:NAD(P)-dependent dehydrogenase (short-subunit alcohol dehydrogenase family)